MTIWCDLREHLISELPNQNGFSALANEFENLLFAYVPLELQSVNSDIAVDLALCVASEQADINPSFFENLLQVLTVITADVLPFYE